MSKEFITCDQIRDAAIKLVHRMYTEDHFMPDIIYDSLRGGAYMANVMSEYYKLIAKKEGKPVFYAAVVARSYGDVKEHSAHVDIDGWTFSPKNLKPGQKVLIVDDIFDTGMTVNALAGVVMKYGIPRDDIKIAVYDYKIPLYKKEPHLPIQPDYWCRKHLIEKPEDSRWIHYTCHEFIGLTGAEIDEVYHDPEVRDILHSVLGC